MEKNYEDKREELDAKLDEIWDMSLFLDEVRRLVEKINEKEELAIQRMDEAIGVYKAATEESRQLTLDEKDLIESIRMNLSHEMRANDHFKLVLLETIKKYFKERIN